MNNIQNKNIDSPWFDMNQAAQYLQVSPKTLSRYCKSGRLAFKKLNPESERSTIRIHVEWLDEFVNGVNNKVKGSDLTQ